MPALALRLSRLRVIDEIENGLSFFRSTFLPALPKVYADLERALGGSGQVVGIVADPGVGKSRLCSEFIDRCRARGLVVQAAWPAHLAS